MRILVIEDEPRILGFLKVGLEAEGFAVDGAEDGASGLALALCEPYELVVLDLQLPHLDGLQVAGRAAPRRPELPVLILSARTDLADEAAELSSSARTTTCRSRSRSTSSSRACGSTCATAASEDASTVRVGALELDLARRRRVSRTASPTCRIASSACSTTSSPTQARS